ncbi:retrovirus-related Pol polyprotein from transposon 412 [Trichonephila clavipes]|nr:retrovirus-related Pol polyprotein from transposon 412 [Trichonephila clavipes]
MDARLVLTDFESGMLAGAVGIKYSTLEISRLDPLIKLSQSLTGNGCVQVVEDQIQIFMYPSNGEIFQDDYAFCHLDKTVQNCFKEHSGQFQQMIQPPRSPEMNIVKHIENMIESMHKNQHHQHFSQLWLNFRICSMAEYLIKVILTTC